MQSLYDNKNVMTYEILQLLFKAIQLKKFTVNQSKQFGRNQERKFGFHRKNLYDSQEPRHGHYHRVFMGRVRSREINNIIKEE